MAYIIDFKEGIATQFTKKIPKTITAQELENMYQFFEKREGNKSEVIAAFAVIITGSYYEAIKGIVAGLAYNRLSRIFVDYLEDNDNKIEVYRGKGVPKELNVTLSVSCVNQGRNGHYYALQGIDLN